MAIFDSSTVCLEIMQKIPIPVVQYFHLDTFVNNLHDGTIYDGSHCEIAHYFPSDVLSWFENLVFTS